MTCTNVNPALCHNMTSPGHNELTHGNIQFTSKELMNCESFPKCLNVLSRQTLEIVAKYISSRVRGYHKMANTKYTADWSA